MAGIKNKGRYKPLTPDQKAQLIDNYHCKTLEFLSKLTGLEVKKIRREAVILGLREGRKFIGKDQPVHAVSSKYERPAGNYSNESSEQAIERILNS